MLEIIRNVYIFTVYVSLLILVILFIGDSIRDGDMKTNVIFKTIFIFLMSLSIAILPIGNIILTILIIETIYEGDDNNDNRSR